MILYFLYLAPAAAAAARVLSLPDWQSRILHLLNVIPDSPLSDNAKNTLRTVQEGHILASSKSLACISQHEQKEKRRFNCGRLACISAASASSSPLLLLHSLVHFDQAYQLKYYWNDSQPQPSPARERPRRSRTAIIVQNYSHLYLLAGTGGCGTNGTRRDR